MNLQQILHPRSIVSLLVLLLLTTASSAAKAQDTVYLGTLLSDPLDADQDDRIGTVVRAHGEFILAAATGDRHPDDTCGGSVFVYRRAAGGYDFVQRISAPQRGDCLHAGTAQRMEVCGDYLFVSSRNMTVETLQEGLVSVYRKTAAGYIPTQVIARPPGMEERELFGYGLGTDGVRMYVTCYRREVAGIEMGAMFIYRNDGGTWVLDQWFENNAFVPGQYYPLRKAMAIDGERIVVASGIFSSIIFQDGPTGWEFESVLASGSNRTATEIDIENGWLIVGDPNMAFGATAGPSFVQVFRWNGTEYEYAQTLQPAVVSRTSNVSDQFGLSVDIRGEELLIGARGRARNGRSSVGGAYLFKLENGAWVEDKLFLPPETTPEVAYHVGSSVRISDGAYLVGAELAETNGIKAGGVYVYERPFGDPLCNGVPNSTGAAAELELYGNSTAAAEALELRASGLPADTFTLFATGQNTAQTPMLGGGQGTLCIAAQGILRLGLTQADANGSATWQVDFDRLPGNPTAGETYHFQTWYRDFAPGPTSNLTSAVSVTLK